MPNLAPGVIFADDDDVVPDVVWISQARRAAALGPDGHLHAAPELAVEVLSPGSANERRDREVKLKLYSRRGVLEYWIVDWRTQQVEVYRPQDGMLCHAGTLSAAETLMLRVCPHIPWLLESYPVPVLLLLIAAAIYRSRGEIARPNAMPQKTLWNLH
jgi:hypothetical protein